MDTESLAQCLAQRDCNGIYRGGLVDRFTICSPMQLQLEHVGPRLDAEPNVALDCKLLFGSLAASLTVWCSSAPQTKVAREVRRQLGCRAHLRFRIGSPAPQADRKARVVKARAPVKDMTPSAVAIAAGPRVRETQPGLASRCDPRITDRDVGGPADIVVGLVENVDRKATRTQVLVLLDRRDVSTTDRTCLEAYRPGSAGAAPESRTP